MAKRYHNNGNGGRRSARKFMERELYAGPEMRNRMEYDSSMMIQEDHRAMANLPEQVVLRYYPETPYQNDRVPDTIVGVDVQMRDDIKHQKKGNFPEKY